MRAAYDRDGFLHFTDAVDVETRKVLLAHIDALIADFDAGAQRTVFDAGADQSHGADRYFLESGDKIRFFLEAGALDAEGRLTCDKAVAVNKIGHALHALDPRFRSFSDDPRFSTLVRGLGLARPRAVQSMVICKPPFVGGEVECHQDATFLHTDPVTVTGLWFALQPATRANGCLHVVPGGHRAGLARRFRRSGDACRMDPPTPGVVWSDATIPLEAQAGDLIVLHGLLPHQSGPNETAAARAAYALHLVDDGARWSADNWLAVAAPTNGSNSPK